MTLNVIEKVTYIVSKTLNIDNVDINSSQDNISEWDSLAYLSILCAIEEEFDIKISERNINNFGSIRQIVSVINSAD